MSTSSSSAWVNRLGMHHFAHLRAVASGLSLQESALRYLGVETVHQAKLAHYQTIDAVKNVARRRAFKTWRLIGLSIPVAKNKAAAPPKSNLPTLDEFIASRDLDGWSEQEVLEMYDEEYGHYSAAASPELKFEDKKLLRREKLRTAQFELLTELEQLAAEKAQPQDQVSGWLDANLAQKLMAEGIVTLQQLRDAIDQSLTWYTKIAGVGKNKALRIEKHLDLLITPQAKEVFILSLPSPTLAPISAPLASYSANTQGLSDSGLFEAWLKAKAQTPATEKSYRRETLRFLLWLQNERNGLRLSNCTEADCKQYIAFLQNIPAHWIAKRKVTPMQPGWLPFRGQLTSASYTQSIAVLSAAFHWLYAERYLAANPWGFSTKKLNVHAQADPFASGELLRIRSPLD